MKTRDGYEAREGMWVSDTTGRNGMDGLEEVEEGAEMRRELDTMPFDQAFWTDEVHEEPCHATGFEVFDEATNRWWNEFVDSDGEIHLG
jgi:hypothetical protein